MFPTFGPEDIPYLGSSVTEIGRYAFHRNNLTSIEIPDSVTEIDSRAFFNNNLTSITIPVNVNITVSGKDASFDDNFGEVYEENDKAAGTYIKVDDEWVWDE